MDFFRVCRACFKREGASQFVSLFEGDGKHRSEFEVTLNVSLYEDKKQNIPALICPSCLTRLEEYSKFKQTAKEVELKINYMRNIQNPTQFPVVAPPPLKATQVTLNPPKKAIEMPAKFKISTLAKKPLNFVSNTRLKTANNSMSKPKEADHPKVQLNQQKRIELKPSIDRKYNMNIYINKERFLMAGKLVFGSELKSFFPLQSKYNSNVDPLDAWQEIYTDMTTNKKKLSVLSFNTCDDSSAYSLFSGLLSNRCSGQLQCVRKDIDKIFLTATTSSTRVPSKIAETIKLSNLNGPLLLAFVVFADPKLSKKRQRMIPELHRKNQFTALQRVPFLRRNLRKFGVTVTYKKDYIEIPTITLPAVQTTKPYNTRGRPKKKVCSQYSTGLKRNYKAKKNTGRTYQKKCKVALSIKPMQTINDQLSGELTPLHSTDHEMSLLLDDMTKNDENAKLLMETIESPALLTTIDSAAPVEMELDMELSGPSSQIQHTQQVKKEKTYEDSFVQYVKVAASNHCSN